MLLTPLKRSVSAGRGLLAVRRRFGAFSLMELVVVIVIVAALAALVTSNVGTTTDEVEAVSARVTMQTIAEAFSGSSAGPGYVADMKHLPGFRHADVRIHDLLSSSSYPTADPFDPVSQRGWRGPYLRNAQGVRNTNAARNGAFPSGNERRTADDTTFFQRGFFTDPDSSPYGITGDLSVADPWGNPIALQIPPVAAFTNPTTDAKRFRYARLVSAGADGVLTTPLHHRLAGLVKLADGKIDISARGDDLVLFLNRSDTHEPEES